MTVWRQKKGLEGSQSGLIYTSEFIKVKIILLENKITLIKSNVEISGNVWIWNVGYDGTYVLVGHMEEKNRLEDVWNSVQKYLKEDEL